LLYQLSYRSSAGILPERIRDAKDRESDFAGSDTGLSGGFVEGRKWISMWDCFVHSATGLGDRWGEIPERSRFSAFPDFILNLSDFWRTMFDDLVSTGRRKIQFVVRPEDISFQGSS
jgi:hypothetical protein